MAGREFDIIDRYFAGGVTHEGEHVVLGPGDDCALVTVPPGEHLCISTDTQVEGVHLPKEVAGDIAAARGFAANLSDLAAMGAKPLGFVLALTLPEEDDHWLEAFARTLDELARRFDMPLIGGNLARGPLSTTFTVFGTVPAGEALRRSGAGDNDDIYISGWPGEAAAGLALLQAEAEASPHPLIDRYLYPAPRVALGQALRAVATAAIDVSDGLLGDLAHIARASSLGASVERAMVPLSASLRESFDESQALTYALSGGDDYELCFTAPPAHRDAVAAVAAELELPLTRIGRMQAGEGVMLVDEKGEAVPVARHGYQHFS